MSALTYPAIYVDDYLGTLNKVASFRKPIIAAVNGFAVI